MANLKVSIESFQVEGDKGLITLKFYEKEIFKFTRTLKLFKIIESIKPPVVENIEPENIISIEDSNTNNNYYYYDKIKNNIRLIFNLLTEVDDLL
jgi:hypothetical protein